MEPFKAVDEGQDVTLHCKVSANPAPHHFKVTRRERDRDRERQRGTERDREGQRETERKRPREIQIERERGDRDGFEAAMKYAQNSQ